MLTREELYDLDLAPGKGSSSWLKALALKRYKFHLTKCEFRDGSDLRYGWDLKNLHFW